MEQMLRVIGMRRFLLNPAVFIHFNQRLWHPFGEKRLQTLFIYCKNCTTVVSVRGCHCYWQPLLSLESAAPPKAQTMIAFLQTALNVLRSSNQLIRHTRLCSTAAHGVAMAIDTVWKKTKQKNQKTPVRYLIQFKNTRQLRARQERPFASRQSSLACSNGFSVEHVVLQCF